MVDDVRPPTLGEIIRQQRELAAVPMRKFAEMVGISNPYLSQIERDLRAPSEQVLAAIAEHLHTSADILTAQAGRADAGDVPEVVAHMAAQSTTTTTASSTTGALWPSRRCRG